jgi:O-antigen ligase/Flp pilus assembly protein TadD
MQPRPPLSSGQPRGPIARKQPQKPVADNRPPATQWQYAAIWLMSLAPVAFFPGALNRFVFLKISLGFAGLACALMSPAGSRLQKRAKILLLAGAGTLFAAALLGQAPVAQILGRAPRYEGVIGGAVYFGALLIGAWLLGPASDPALRGHLIRATTVAASVIALLAIVEATGLHPLATTASRPGSFLGNATEQGAYGAGVAGLLLPHLRRGRYWALGGLGAGVVLVVTSASRGAILALLVAAVVVLLAGTGRQRLITGCVVAVGALASMALPLTRHRLLLQSPLSLRTVNGRGYEWSDAWQLIEQHPILGVGPSGFLDASPATQSAAYVRLAGSTQLDSPHSLPLQLAAGGGVVLVVLAALLALLTLRGFLSLRRDVTQTAWALGVAAALAGWGTCLLTHFTAPGSTPFFLMLAGSLLAERSSALSNQVRRRAVAGLAAGAAVLAFLAAVAEVPLRTGLVALHQGRVSQAEGLLAQAHALRPWDPDLDAQIAHALIIQPQPSATAATINEYLVPAQQSLPGDPWVLADRGLFTAQQGTPAQALTLLDRAIRLAPNDPGIHLLRGQVRAHANDVNGAAKDLRTSASLSPHDPVPLEVLASVYQRAGLLKEAELALAESRRLNQ